MRPVINCTKEEKKTKSNFKDECNINKLMEKYKKTGKLPELIKENPQYGDFSKSIDFQQAQNTILKASVQFQNLSAYIRNRFENSPRKFLEFCENPESREEMIKMGLIEKPKVKPEEKKPEIKPDVKPDVKEQPKK